MSARCEKDLNQDCRPLGCLVEADKAAGLVLPDVSPEGKAAVQAVAERCRACALVKIAAIVAALPPDPQAEEAE